MTPSAARMRNRERQSVFLKSDKMPHRQFLDDNAQGDENGCGMMVVEVDDENGDVVDDMDDNGNPEDDVEVDVDEMAQSGANAGTMLTFHTAQNGSFLLKGLPKGRVTITATRVHDGVTTIGGGKKSVRELRSRRMRLRLHPAQ